MARGKKKEELTLEEKLERALVPVEEQPYEVPENWCFFRFTSLIDIEGGTQPPKSQFVEEPMDGYVRLVQIRDFASDKYVVYVPDTKNLRKFNKDDVMIARYGASIGRICTGLEGAYNVALAKTIFSREVLNRDYVYWMLQSETFQYPLRTISRSAQAGFNKKDLSNFLLPLPPLAVQKRIVDRIESLFAKLDEAKEKVTEVVESYLVRRATILDFAFSGKLTSKWRTQNNIDNNWSEKTFSEVAVIKSNLVKPGEYQDFPHIAPDNIEKRTGVLLQYNTIAEDKVTSGKHRFYPGQILYSKIRPYLSKVVMVDFDGLCSADMYPIEAKENTRYLWYYMLSDNFLEQASSAGSRSVLPKINQKELSKLLVNIPDIDEQKEVVKILDRLLPYEQKVAENAQVVLEQIDVIKKSILFKAFRGELGTNNPEEESAIKLLKKILVET